MKEYPLSKGARSAMVFIAILMILLVVTIPITIYIFWRLSKARVVLTDKGLEAVNMFRSTRFDYADVARLGTFSVAVVSGGGLAGAMARDKAGGAESLHLIAKTRDGKDHHFMVSNYERYQEILDEVGQRLGMPYEQVMPGAAGAFNMKWPS